jgi:hypothetical protein
VKSNTRTTLVPQRLGVAVTILAAVSAGAAYPLLRDAPLQSQAIVALSVSGIAALLVIPSRRLALVCAWVLVFPLSLEKVFPLLHPTFRTFFIPPVVLSGGDIVLGLLTASLVVESLFRRRSAFIWPAAGVPFLLLGAWVAITFVLNQPTSEGVLQLLHWLKMGVFLVVMSSAIRNREELLTVLLAVAVAILVQTILVGFAYFFKRHFGFSASVAEAHLLALPTSVSGGTAALVRATGTLGHPNQQAMYQTMFTIPLFALVMVRNWLWRLFAAALLVASGCAVILTFSRTSWIAILVGAAVILILAARNHRIKRQAILGMCLGSVATVALIGVFSGPILTRLTKADDGASLSRIHLALLAIEHVSRNPIAGVGPGNFVTAKLVDSEGPDWGRAVWLPRGVSFKARYIDDLELGFVELGGHSYYTSLPAHNKLLLVAAELGLVGVALFLWFQWRLIRTVLEGLGTSDALLWWVGAALMGTFAATVVEYMLELFYDDKTMLMPLFTNVLMISFGRIAARGKAAPCLQ